MRFSRRRLLPATLLPFISPALRAAGRRPSNLLLVYHPNGLENGWQPRGGETDFTLPPVLAALNKYRAKLLIVGGLIGGIQNEVMGHPQGMTSLWTGARIKNDADFAGHTSLDQLVAARIGVGTPFRSLELGVQTQPTGKIENSSVMIYGGPGRPMQAEDDPNRAFDRLFAGGGDPAALERVRREKGSVFELVRGQLTDVRRHYGGPERQLLDQHTQAVGDLEKRLAGLGKLTCQDKTFAKHARGEAVRLNAALFPEVARLQVDLLALALGCGLTRVASLQLTNSTSGTQIPGANDRYGIHTVMHTRPREEKVKINEWFAGQLAHLLDRFEATKLADGRSLLDDTLVVWGTEMAVGNHLNGPIPFVIAGGGGSWFRLGRWKNLTGTPRHTRLLVSVAHAMGVEDLNELGDYRAVNDRGPLEELRA